MRSWDGYAGSNSDVLDGSSFSLEAEFSDGQTVSAGGSNATPQGYGDFFNALLGAF